MSFRYDETVCDLCGSPQSTSLIALNNGHSMRSDRGLLPYNLSKLICSRCGLVRSGSQHAELYDYYTDQYVLSTQTPEHYFYTADGPVSRSTMLCDWLVTAMGEHRWRGATRCLEVGAGSGALLRTFTERFPQLSFEGIELNKAAAEIAQHKGLSVWQSPLEDFDGGPYDIIYSVAVLEHVPSPTDFLREIHKRLRPGGWLYLCQPTQDVPSYDVFFADHISHFGTEHLHQYAAKCGFRDRGFCVGHEWMPNFSLHMWQAIESPENAFTWSGPPGYTTCRETAQTVQQDMARLDATLAQMAAQDRKVAIFGLNEVYWLARVYSMLNTFPVRCGLDDSPNKPEYAQLEFPVIRPEEASAFEIQDVILAMNKVYYGQATRRLQTLGLEAHPILS